MMNFDEHGPYEEPRLLPHISGHLMAEVLLREAAVALVVAVDRYVADHAEADEAVRRQLWQAMTSASESAAELFAVYPL